MGRLRLALALVGGVAALAASACSADPDERISVSEAAIAGGVVAPDDTAVVGIYDDTSGATCTGALVAPNVVLTAQHCVADFSGPFECGITMFGPPKAAASFHVTTKPAFGFAPGDYHAVNQVVVPAGGTGVCGSDVALLLLADLVSAGEAEPLVPRVDLAAATGEAYSAIGFGATDDSGTGAGERRRRDDLVVACGGVGCASSSTTEWLGEAGVCGGDSGGPALDAIGRVIGVASRGSVGCVDPIYGDVASYADWIKTETQMAAIDAGYPPPPWSTGAPTDPSGGGGNGGGGAASGGSGGSASTGEGGGGAGGSSGSTSGDGATGGSDPPPAVAEGDGAASDGGCTCGTSTTRRVPWTSMALLALALLRIRRRP